MTIHAAFIDNDIATGNRVNAAWLNAVNQVVYAGDGPLTEAQITALLLNSGLGYVNVKWWGATANKTTDNLAYFNSAATYAIANKLAIYIPAAAPGFYYRLSGPWVLTSATSLKVFGDGNASLLVMANATGGNGITLSATSHATFCDFGIYGTSGSGNGIELTNASDNNKFRGLWLGWMDGDGIKITSGQSNVFTDCDIDQNSGYRPATLVGGLVDGAVDRAVHNPAHASGLTNNNTFVNCRINAAGSVVGLKVGTSGVGVNVVSFAWIGGLIQGLESLVHMVETKSCSILAAHLEPPVGVLSTYVVTFDGCVNTQIANCDVAGDTKFLNACDNCGFANVSGCGLDVSATSTRSYWHGGTYRNISTGPGGGNIIDRSGMLDSRDLRNASNERFHAAHNVSPRATVYFDTNMQDWVGGASPTVPCGFSVVGGTLTRSTTTPLPGSTYSAQHVLTGDLTQYLTITLQPALLPIAKFITVQAWVYNVTTAGLAFIGMVEGGTGNASYQGSYLADTWERMLVSFQPNASATSAAIRFTGSIGTIRWGRIRIMLDNFVPLSELDLDNTGTPSMSYGGRPVRNLVTTGTAAITNILEPHYGNVSIRLGASTDFTDSAGFQLQGGINWTAGVAGDTLDMSYGSDGVWRETGRSVN